ncbi:MAG: TetR family transcriptional regulator C-terminal domain-containing protein, partial [Clostridia bacterium]|nr:TetR family transcriptional regulator C-terminal domain-containing protein [Clostridia bacterium]
DQQFIAEFLSYGVSGSIINWILTGMKETPENIVMRIKNIINDSKSGTVARYIKDAIT